MSSLSSSPALSFGELIQRLRLVYMGWEEWWLTIICLFGIRRGAFLFATIGITASDFFCPNLATVADRLGMAESTAGVTFLAFGYVLLPNIQHSL
jgi:hypothetical protein